MPDRSPLVTCVAASVGGVLLSAFVHSMWAYPNIYSDIFSFWQRGWVAAGQVPYTPGAFLEYPPLSGLVLYASEALGGGLAGAAGGSYAGYYLAFTLYSLAAGALLGWSAWRLGRALGVAVNPLYFVLPSFVLYSVYNFDLFNALFILLSVQLFVEKRGSWSAAALGMALATKLVAVVLIPVFLIELPDWRERGRYLAVSIIIAAVFFVPIAVFNFGYFTEFISFFRNWGLEDAWYIWIFQDPFSSTAKAFGVVLLGLLLLRVYTLKLPLVERGFLALAAYLLATTVYSPQFNVMLIPLLAVLALESPFVYTMDVFNALIILTWLTVPVSADYGPTYAGTVPQLMALLRSASLALVAVAVASRAGYSPWGWFRGKMGPRRAGAGRTIFPGSKDVADGEARIT